MFALRNQPSSHRMIQVFENCLQLRGRLVSHYALLEEDRIILIDGGFFSTRPEQTIANLESIGRKPEEISHILITHGHIDHTLNLSRWKQLTDARLLAPGPDREHIAGTYPYRGLNSLCGLMEGTCRALFGYQPPEIDEWFSPGDQIPVWGGLEVIPLPGHTLGHCGFYSASKQLLFPGDLFSNYHHDPKPPPPWFNVDRSQMLESILRASQLDIENGLLPSHCHDGTPLEHRDDLYRIIARLNLTDSP